jgi:endonuclease V-like protein UPF0215 family
LRLHPFKRGLRVLAVAESFSKEGEDRSVLAGVVMRKDGVIDGFAMTSVTIGGMDATDGVLDLFKSMGRNDINLIMLNGCVIAWFNVIDLAKLHEVLNLPLVCVTYEESSGLEKYIKEYFPDDWERRINVLEKNCNRQEALLHTGHRVFLREVGLEFDDAVRLLNEFTLQGGVPEPLRLAGLLARTVHMTIHKGALQ